MNIPTDDEKRIDDRPECMKPKFVQQGNTFVWTAHHGKHSTMGKPPLWETALRVFATAIGLLLAGAAIVLIFCIGD